MLAAWPCVLQRRLKAVAKEEAAEPAAPSLLSPPIGSSTPNTEGTDPQRQKPAAPTPPSSTGYPIQHTLPFPAAPAGPFQLSPQTQTISISCSNISNK